MKIMRYFILISLLTFAANGCQNSAQWQELARAEAMTMDEPEEAFAVLDSLDGVGAKGELAARIKLGKANSIYYSNELTADNDSDASAAIKYFEKHGDVGRTARAYFLRAHQCMDAGVCTDALVDLLNAERFATQTNDSTQLGLVYRTMAECYSRLEDMSSAVAYSRKSYEIFNAIQSERYLGWALYEYGRCLSNALRYEEALPLIVECDRWSRENGDEYLNNSCINLHADVLYYMNKYAEANELFSQFKLTPFPDIKRRYWMNYGRSLIEVGRIDEARALQDSLSKYFPEEKYLSLRLAYSNDDKDEIIRALQRLIDEQDSSFITLYNREFANVVDAYYKEQQAVAEARAERQRTLAWAAAVIVLLLGTLLWLEVRRRRTERREDAATIRLLQENLSEQEERNNRSVAELRCSVRRLLTERVQEAERLCQDYESAPTARREQAIYKRIRQVLDDFAPGTPYLRSVEKTMDGLLGGVMSDLRRDYPDLKEGDFALYLYELMGMPRNVSSVLLGIKLGNYYARKSRLASRLSARYAGLMP